MVVISDVQSVQHFWASNVCLVLFLGKNQYIGRIPEMYYKGFER